MLKIARPPGESTSEYDVIVVGAGPCGSTASYLLSKLGHRVLLVEKRTFPRHKTCGGGLTHKTIRLLDRVFDLPLPALKRRGVINYSSRRYGVYLGSRRLLSERLEQGLHFTRRSEYDEFLLRSARDNGVTTWMGEGVKRIDPDRVRVETTRGRTAAARYILGADGVHSRVRRELIGREQLGVSEAGWKHQLAMALEAYIDRSVPGCNFRVPLLYLGVLKWGYGWVFPHRNRCLVGVGGLRRKNGNFRRILERFLDRLDLPAEGSGCEIKGHPIPYGNFMTRPVSGNVLLAGDAAGMVDSFSAEGIFYAQRSAELAAWAIHRASEGERPVSRLYPRLLRKHVLPELEGSLGLRPFFYQGPRTLRFPLLHLGLRALHPRLSQTIQGDRIYAGLRDGGRRRHGPVTG